MGIQAKPCENCDAKSVRIAHLLLANREVKRQLIEVIREMDETRTLLRELFVKTWPVERPESGGHPNWLKDLRQRVITALDAARGRA